MRTGRRFTSKTFKPECEIRDKKVYLFLGQLEVVATQSLTSTGRLEIVVKPALIKCLLKDSAMLYYPLFSLCFTFKRSGSVKGAIDPDEDF